MGMGIQHCVIEGPWAVLFQGKYNLKVEIEEWAVCSSQKLLDEKSQNLHTKA